MGIIYNASANQDVAETTLKDYSTNAYDGHLGGSATFDRNGFNGYTNCLKFPDGRGTVTVYNRVVESDGNFTILFWVKLPTDCKKVGVQMVWGQNEEDREEISTEITPNVWTHIAVVKEADIVSLYVNQVIQERMQCSSAELIAFAITEDNQETYARASMAGIVIYNYSLTFNQIKIESIMNNYLNYSLDGVSFRDYDVYVSDSNGLLDRPKMKAATNTSWADEHGTYVDLEAPRLEARDITLKCFCHAESKLEFSMKVNSFLHQFDKKGLRRLQVDIEETHPLVFDVYLPNVVAVDKRWNDGTMVGTFSMKLTEPRPMKKVIRFDASGSSSMIMLTFKQREKDYNHLYTITWGDGNTYEFSNAEETVAHSYYGKQVYYAIVAGDIDNITSTEEETQRGIERTITNGEITWEKI